MQIQLSDHFTYKKLLRFVFPSIVMMLFNSIYGVVDGLFVSNCVGKTPFAAVNLIFPFVMMVGSIGFMVGTGGSAIVGKTLGEGKRELANEYFTRLVTFTVLASAALAVLGFAFVRPAAILLGADEEMLPLCVLYGRISFLSLPALMLQNVFSSFFVTAERPQTGLYVTVAAGCTNILMDFLLVGVFPLGIAGAAAATALSQTVGGLLPVFLFRAPKKGLLAFARPKAFYGNMLLRTCTNGVSELLSNISMSLVGMLYNFQLLRIAGQDGIAAYGVIMYVNFFFLAVFLGYSVGSAPIVSFHFGAGNRAELRNLLRKSTLLIGASGIAMTALGFLCAPPLSALFVGYDESLCAMTVHGFRLYTLSFFACGFGIYGSSFFTALNNGPVSAVLSTARTVVFEVATVLLLPMLWGLDGVWLATVVSEYLAFLLTVIFVFAYRKKYGYL